MLTRRWRPFAAGFAAFVAAHVVESAKWADWFGGRYRPWFLNSGRALLLTAVCVFVVGALSSLRRDSALGAGTATAAGATAALCIVLLFAGDPGSIYPLVLAAGAAAVSTAAIGGALLASVLRGSR